MDLAHLFKALLLGVVEGITEFLPISSTGHLILLGDWLAFDAGRARIFDVVIQLGAILAVCWLYRRKIASLFIGILKGDATACRVVACVTIAFLPSAVVGVLFIHTVKMFLFNAVSVASALIIGGVLMLLVERYRAPPRCLSIESLSWRQALVIGLAQCLALLPGTSRSGATIVGGMLAGLSRATATEFSFFVAIPTIFGATIYDGYQHYHLLSVSDLWAIVVGFTAAFLSALAVVRILVHWVAYYSFRGFAWYRIVLGCLIFGWMLLSS